MGRRPEGKREEADKGQGEREGATEPGLRKVGEVGTARSSRTCGCGGTPRRARPLAAPPRQSPAVRALKPRPSPVRTPAPDSLLSRGPIVPAVVRGRKVYADGLCRRWARGEWGRPGPSGCPSLLVGAAGEGVRGGQRRGAGAWPSRRPARSLRRQVRALLPASTRSVARGRGPHPNTAIWAPGSGPFPSLFP